MHILYKFVLLIEYCALSFRSFPAILPCTKIAYMMQFVIFLEFCHRNYLPGVDLSRKYYSN